MGAWAADSFGNDDAADFVYAVEEHGVSAIKSAIEAAREEQGDGYMEAPTASCLIAAGEFIAVSRGKPPAKLPEEVATLAQRLKIPASLAEETAALVVSMLEASELRELWDDSEDAAEWRAAVEDLIERLK